MRKIVVCLVAFRRVNALVLPGCGTVGTDIHHQSNGSGGFVNGGI